MRLVVCRDGLSGNGAVAGDLEAVACRPFPDFGCAGLPLGAGDLGAWLAFPGHPDGLAYQVGGAPGLFHGQFGEDGAGEFAYGAAGPLAFQRSAGRSLTQPGRQSAYAADPLPIVTTWGVPALAGQMQPR